MTVNLAPADLPKESGRFDLAMALGILAASGQIPADRFADYEFAGELSLNGELRAVHGALAMTWFAHQSRRAFILPAANAQEAALVDEAEILPARTLLEVCAHLTQREMLTRYRDAPKINGAEYPDLSDVKGQAHAKRALEICAAGNHSVLMVGPPGTGKSMLAARFPGLLPPMRREEALESAPLQSLGSEGFRVERFGVRCFRSPHHTASAVALVGGGGNPQPGEISLAHNGVLFLDELGVRSTCFGSSARTAGVWPYPYFARRKTGRIPRKVPVGRSHEPVPLRLPWTQRQMSLYPGPGGALPQPDFRSAARPHRFAD
jgi:magnesium chelatase family protein